MIAGSYVAFYLSSFSVTRIFKASLPKSAQNLFRKALIVTQFAISIGLLSYTLLVTLQLKYSKNINPGFDREQILVLPLIGAHTKDACSLLQQNFAYRISVSWWIFFITGLLIFSITVITISFQATRAALANPVKSLITSETGYQPVSEVINLSLRLSICL